MSLLRFSACLLAFACGCARAPVARVEWTTMGTVAAVQMRGGTDAALASARASTRTLFDRVEKLLNAHAADSEISRLAGRSDGDILASCDVRMRPCYEVAFALMRQTDGAFNPRWRGPGTFDLGAIAKGFAVDLAAQSVADGTASGDFLVDLGGNLKAVRGDWTVGVRDGASFVLREGEACATSARYFRGNHIKDGRTGGDVSTSIHSVTVIHPTSALLADGLSTVLFILGREKGEDFVKKHYPNVRIIWL